MKYVAPLLFVLGLAGFVPSAARADAAAAPERRLVYSFTYGTNSDLEVHGSNGYASDTHSGSGSSRDYVGTIQDKGTITVDVLREQPDTGLVVNVSEQAEQTRKADVATCVVYGNTNIICDPYKTVNSEEYTLLRFLGTRFIDPNQIDAKQHWRIDQGSSGSSMVADYTIRTNAAGVMTIDETRTIKNTGGASPSDSDVSAKLVYDYNRLAPTSVDEYVTQRLHPSSGQVQTITIQTSLKMVSDSMAKP